MACPSDLHPDLHLSAASTGPGVHGAESRKQPPSREVHADELRGGDVVEVGGRWLRLRSRSIEASAVRVRFADDTEVRYRRDELVRIIRGGLAPYVGEDGDIDWCRWGIDNGESPVDEYEETG